jgi:N-acetylmuramoyl-L-alanine amidase
MPRTLVDEILRSHPNRWLCKEAKFKARESRGVRRTSSTPQRPRDEAQRRNWTIYEAILVSFFLFVLCLCPLGDRIQAAGLSDAFFEAERCARALRKDPKAVKNPPAWTTCIEKFQAVYRQEPKGPWAPPSLYNSGMLYMDLARQSGSESDKKAATDQFELLQKKFPDSGYRERVAAELQKLSAPGPLKNDKPAKEPAGKTAAAVKGKAADKKKEDPGKASALSSASAAAGQTYRKGEECFRKLHSGQPTEGTRREWMLCIGRFHSVYLEDPAGELAAASLFQEGVLYQDLYKGLKFDSDQRAARENFEKVVKEYPQSPYAAKAGRELQGMAPSRAEAAAVARRAAAALPEREPPPGAAPESAVEPRRAPAPGEEGLAVVEDLRYWSNPNYTRVVIYTDRDTDFTHHLLKKDPALDKPPRLFVDLSNSTMGSGVLKTIPINDDLLSDARAARNTLDSVRVVVDIKSFETYKVFSLRDPFRIVIDVWGGNGAAKASAGPPAEPAEPALDAFIDKTRKMPRGALAKQLALGVRRVVIDPGTGQGLRCTGLRPGRARKGRGAGNRQTRRTQTARGARPGGGADPDRRPLPHARRTHGLRQHPHRRPVCLHPHQRLARPPRVRHRDLFPEPGDRRRIHPGRRDGERHLHQEHQRPALDPERPAQERQDQ